MASSTCLPSASSTSPNTTLAPSRTNRSASAAPWPRAPPLISATLPSSFPMSSSLSYRTVRRHQDLAVPLAPLRMAERGRDVLDRIHRLDRRRQLALQHL